MTLALGHPSVKSMLEHISSRELAEWMAYERFAGPVGPEYRDEVARQTLEMARVGNYLTGGQFKSNPVPQPKKPYPTPSEWLADAYKAAEEEE